MRKAGIKKSVVTKMQHKLGRPNVAPTIPASKNIRESSDNPVPDSRVASLANNPSAPGRGEAPTPTREEAATYADANFESDSTLHIPSGGGSRRHKGSSTIPYKPIDSTRVMDASRVNAYTQRAFPSKPAASGDLSESVPKKVARGRAASEASRLDASRTRESRSRLGRGAPATVVTQN